MYPEERMFRDRILGSMRDSSASGVFRIRPASAVWGRCSGGRQWPCEGPWQGQGQGQEHRQGQGQPARLHPPAEPPSHARGLAQLLDMVARTKASCQCGIPVPPAGAATTLLLQGRRGGKA